jgi:site-specific recombinase XerD
MSMTDFTLYDLRYPFASRLVMSGVDPLMVQALMRHRDISMTLRHTHLSNDYKQWAVRTRGAFKQNP